MSGQKDELISTTIMTFEQQVCGLELAKRLKELGVKQESLYWWSETYECGVTEHTPLVPFAENSGEQRGTEVLCSGRDTQRQDSGLFHPGHRWSRRDTDARMLGSVAAC